MLGGSPRPSLARIARYAVVSSVRWRDWPAGPAKRGRQRSHRQALQLPTQRRPALIGGGLGDADQQQRQPAQRHVGADALLLAVVDRSQVDHLLQIVPAPLDLQQLLVAQRDVLGAGVIVKSCGSKTQA
jgi:hypothetical protein